MSVALWFRRALLAKFVAEGQISAVRRITLFAVLFLQMSISPMPLHAQTPRPSVTSQEAVAALREAMGRSGLTRSEYSDVHKIAGALTQSDTVALLNELVVKLKDKTAAKNGESVVLDAVFNRLANNSPKTAIRYLRIVAPKSLDGGGLAAYMGVRGKLGGMPELFDFFHHAENAFARAQLFYAIEEAFFGFNSEAVSQERFVRFVERWYEKNRAQLIPDQDFHTINGPSRAPIPDGYVLIGVFLAPESLVKRVSDQSGREFAEK